jgi:hypothetical protein
VSAAGIGDACRHGEGDRGAAAQEGHRLAHAQGLPAPPAPLRRGRPAREGIRACWQGRTKILNEHLGPLRRYLDRQIGRPWDKVFSEICARIDRSNAVQDHVRDHVADYVTTHVLLIDGVPCNGEGGRDYGKPLHQFR